MLEIQNGTLFFRYKNTRVRKWTISEIYMVFTKSGDILKNLLQEYCKS